jgi:peptidoglycan/LPS O-acetylase OafA/YrhL
MRRPVAAAAPERGVMNRALPAATITSTRTDRGPQYRADVDGIRAIAVLMVVAYHAFPNAMPGGFIGVDVFFVISGFLITGNIIRDVDRNTFTFLDFYARRCRRIVPALAVMMRRGKFFLSAASR